MLRFVFTQQDNGCTGYFSLDRYFCFIEKGNIIPFLYIICFVRKFTLKVSSCQSYSFFVQIFYRSIWNDSSTPVLRSRLCSNTLYLFKIERRKLFVISALLMSIKRIWKPLGCSSDVAKNNSTFCLIQLV